LLKGIEQCRLACGGHGYSHASALPELYACAVAGCTYEGENVVMLLGVAKYTLKNYYFHFFRTQFSLF
jgi:acyl-CoA oxidase